MKDLKTFELVQLVDLLTKETTRYFKLLKFAKGKKEFLECKMMIEDIQVEISRRKKKES
jgi:hypothetical protein